MTEAEQLDLARAYADTFSTPHGARVLEDLKRRGYVGRSTLTAPITGAPLDALHTAANEGRRGLVLELMALVELGRRGRPLEAQTAAHTAADREEPA